MWSRSIHHKHTKSLIIVVRPKHPPNCSKFTTDVQFRITLTDHSSSGHWPSFADVGRSSAIGVDFFHNFVQAKYQPLCAVNSGTNYKYCRLQRVMYCIRRTAVVARKKTVRPRPMSTVATAVSSYRGNPSVDKGVLCHQPSSGPQKRTGDKKNLFAGHSGTAGQNIRVQ